MDKKLKKQLRTMYKEKEKSIFKNSLPLEKKEFLLLFNYLDEMLDIHQCDNTLKFTLEFLRENNLPIEKSLDWLRENGGFCDCEVLANIEEKIMDL